MQKHTRLAWIAVIFVVVLISIAGGVWYVGFRSGERSSDIALPRDMVWGLSLTQVKAQEAKQTVSYVEAEKPDQLIYKATFGNLPAALGYAFEQQRLTRIQFTALRKNDSTDAEFLAECRENFMALQQYFERTYGQPAGTVQAGSYRQLSWYGSGLGGTTLTLQLDLNRPLWTVSYQAAPQPDNLSVEDGLNYALQFHHNRS